MTIVSNTTPLHYLILIGCQELLHTQYKQIIIPPAVVTELMRPETPEVLHQWISMPPSWLEVRTPKIIDQTLNLGMGEKAAISLAMELDADHILLDD